MSKRQNLVPAKPQVPVAVKRNANLQRKHSFKTAGAGWDAMSIANRSDLYNSCWKQNWAAYWCRETTTVNVKLRGVKSEEKPKINSPFSSFSSLSFIYLLFTLPLLSTTIVQTNNQETQFYTYIQQQQNPNKAGVTISLWTKEDMQQQRC